jgi:anti-sigma factor RsiW
VDASSHAALEALSAFVDGELDPAEGHRIQTHVDACASCSARVAEFARISNSLAVGQSGYPECALISSFVDGEGSLIERRAASSHLGSCAACRAALVAFRATDSTLRSLPMLTPSPRTDAHVAALAGNAPIGRRPKLGFGWAMPRIAIAAAAAGLVLLSSLNTPPGALSRLPVDGALVASAQQAVFNPRTNTLYVLDAERGEVAAVDASTRVEQARIVVGGRPSALALNVTANTVLVLDGSQKRLTEIDASNNTVVSAGRIDVSGTPTSMRVDPQGRIVVSSVLAPSTAGSGSPEPAPAGQVTVFDSASKQVESVKTVDVAPQSVVFDPAGKRALLLSADATTVADAATYRAIDQLPAGIAATFDVSGRRIAVLAARDGAAELMLFGDAGTTSIPMVGVPVAVIALPDGGFGVLVRAGSGGRITIVGPDAKVRSTIDVALSGSEITFDAATARFAVIGGGGVAYATVSPTDVAAARPTEASAPSGAPSPTPVATPAPSPSPAAQRSPEPPVVASLGSVPPGAQLAWTGLYRLEVPGNHRPLRVAGSGARIWFVDQTMALASIDTATAAVSVAARLPTNWTVGDLLVGDRLVVAIDPLHGRVAVYDKTLERFDLFDFTFAQSARSFALGPDDWLWMAAPQGGTLIALDVRAKRAQAVDTGATGISSISVDSGGRVSYADAVRKVLGTYDEVSHRLSEVPLARVGRVTSLLTDGAGSRWAGTDAGELIVQRADGNSNVVFAPGPIQVLELDGAGVLWFASATAAGVAFGPAADLARAQLGPGTLTGLAFDSQGSAWAADSRDGVFYIVKAAR